MHASFPGWSSGRPGCARWRSGGRDGRQGRGGLTVPGSLTVRDVTRPVTLLAGFTDVAARSFTVRATTRIDRTEFGVTGARGLAGRYLDVTVEVPCARS